VETPVAETPAVETPVAETPAVETPVAETPAVETPVAETPAVETPVTEIPAVETPVTEIPAVETPVAEIPAEEVSVAEEAELLEPAEEEELWICSKCNRENRGKSRFCSGCGESKVKDDVVTDDQGQPKVVYADLIIYDSKGNSKRVSLLNERITIGRVDPLAQIYPDIDLTFFDSEQIVSRRHCEIFQKPPGQYFLVDIGSSNGTFLNRKKIQKGVSLLLNDNDEVHFAKTRTIFSQSLD
ncbi:MAG: FHA domain-containing protein, partial [Candidatus Eremiobacterota bacterium]